MTDKHNIPKGKIHSNWMLLSDHIVCKITQRNIIRRANTCDPALKLLNEEIKFLHGQNNLTLNPDKTTCTLFTPDPADIPNNKQQSTTHGNAPKGSWSYLRPKTHIQHTHPQHLSTSTLTSTNHKSTHCNRMGQTGGDTHDYL